MAVQGAVRSNQFDEAHSLSGETLTPSSASLGASFGGPTTLADDQSSFTRLRSEESRALSVENSGQAHANSPSGLNSSSTRSPNSTSNVKSPIKHGTTESTTKESRRTFLTSYSSLQKGDPNPAHDFQVVIVERESSGESSAFSDEDGSVPGPGSLEKRNTAIKALGIFHEWDLETIQQDQQQLDWGTFGREQQVRGCAKYKSAWRRDMLLRNCKRQIQAKLRGNHYLPTSNFKANTLTQQMAIFFFYTRFSLPPQKPSWQYVLSLAVQLYGSAYHPPIY